MIAIHSVMSCNWCFVSLHSGVFLFFFFLHIRSILLLCSIDYYTRKSLKGVQNFIRKLHFNRLCSWHFICVTFDAFSRKSSLCLLIFFIIVINLHKWLLSDIVLITNASQPIRQRKIYTYLSEKWMKIGWMFQNIWILFMRLDENHPFFSYNFILAEK